MKRTDYIKGVLTGILISIAVCAVPAAAGAEVVGTVLSTDIGTVIDGAACKTYNVDGRTFVVAEDLQGYGFDVDWNENERVLSITQNPYSYRTLLPQDELKAKWMCTIGEPIMDIFESDVVVTVADQQIEGYNINGYMVIPVRALEPCAYVEYDDEKRLVTINSLKHYLDECYGRGEAMKSESEDYQEINLNNENGQIYYYSMELPDIEYSNGKVEKQDNHIKWEICDTNGNRIYARDNHISTVGCGFLITTDKVQLINRNTSGIYGYWVMNEKPNDTIWPSDEEINNADLKFEKFLVTGYELGILSEEGYLFQFDALMNGNREIIRCNIQDTTLGANSRNFFLSKDGVLYDDKYSFFSSNIYIGEQPNSVLSLFDRVIATDVKEAQYQRYDKGYVLHNNGDLCYYVGESGNGSVFMTNISDFSAYTTNPYQNGGRVLMLTNDGELYDGFYYEGQEISDLTHVASNIKRTQGTYFINNNNEFYKYNSSLHTCEKIADNIAELVSSDLYLTVDGTLTDLTTDFAYDVRDATKYRDGVIYIIKTDGTLWYYNDGELARVKAFE